MIPASSSYTCHHDPIVLRISLPPGASPELSVPLIEAAIRRHLERRGADDFPMPATRAEKLAELHHCLDFYRAQQEAAKCRP